MASNDVDRVIEMRARRWAFLSYVMESLDAPSAGHQAALRDLQQLFVIAMADGTYEAVMRRSEELDQEHGRRGSREAMGKIMTSVLIHKN
jgi:hypothetical protein